jgi:hypothetical protein
MRSLVRDSYRYASLITRNLNTSGAETRAPKTDWAGRPAFVRPERVSTGDTQRDTIADLASTWARRLHNRYIAQVDLLEQIEADALGTDAPTSGLIERLVAIAAVVPFIRKETTTDFADYSWETEARYAAPWGERLVPVEKTHLLIIDVCDKGDARARRVDEFRAAIRAAGVSVWCQGPMRTTVAETSKAIDNIANSVVYDNMYTSLEEALAVLKANNFVHEAAELSAAV